MAIDQRDITSQLRMMGDPELRQYAAMHKNDPYIFPLAFQESQNRQRVRMSGQAQMGGQEMPKVNDAALMAMAPQAAPQQAPQGQGISNLPAPNMQRMADGGIAGYGDDEEGMAAGGMAGYGDGDDVPRRTIDGMAQGGMYDFAQRSEPVVRMAGGGVTKMSTGGDVDAARARRRVAQDALYRYGLKQRRDDPEGFQAAQAELSAAEDELKAAEASYATEMAGSNLNRPATGRKDVGLAATETSKAKYPPSEATRVKDFPGVKPDFEKMPVETSDAPPAKAKVKTKVQAPVSNVEAPAPTPDALASLGIVPYGQSKAGDAPAAPTYTPKTAEEIRAGSEALAKPELEKIQASYKPFGEQFAQDRSRIDTREKNMLSDLLIRGGLKAMGGKSQFAMQNLSEGGLEALNVYQETQKTNDAARKALTQSEMLMSQAQRAEERGARGEAVSLFAQAQKDQQVGLQFQQKAQEMANTKEYQQGSLLVAQQNAESSKRTSLANMLSAQNRGAGAGAMALSKEAQLKLNAAKLELADISKQLEKDVRLGLPKNAETKARLEARRNQLRADIAKLGGSDTISEIPLAGSGSGDKVLDFAKI
jgi:hypothetical protein